MLRSAESVGSSFRRTATVSVLVPARSAEAMSYVCSAEGSQTIVSMAPPLSDRGVGARRSLLSLASGRGYTEGVRMTPGLENLWLRLKRASHAVGFMF